MLPMKSRPSMQGPNKHKNMTLDSLQWLQSVTHSSSHWNLVCCHFPFWPRRHVSSDRSTTTYNISSSASPPASPIPIGCLLAITSLVSLLRPASAARGEIGYWSPDLWVGSFDHWGSHIRLVLALRYYRRKTDKSLSLLLWKASLLLIFSRDCFGYWLAVRKLMTAGQGHRSFDNTKSLENMANGERVPLDSCGRLHGICQPLLYRKSSILHPPCFVFQAQAMSIDACPLSACQ